MAIEKLYSFLCKPKSSENMFNLMKSIMSGCGKETMTLEGKALQHLPEQLSCFTNGLKKPKVVLALKSSKKGSGVVGIKLLEGEKTVNAFAMGLDTTRGNVPIFQFRGRSYVDGQKSEGLSLFLNSNVKLNPKNYDSVSINKGTNKTFEMFTENGELAQAFHYEGSGVMSKMAKDVKALKPSDFNNEVRSFRDFWLRKGKSTIPSWSCEKELLQIVQTKGKPTLASVTQAKDMLVKRMGYDPKLLPIECLSAREMGFADAAFDPIAGKVLINQEVLAKCSNTEVALLLSHELQHMDDFVKLSKSIGTKGLQKLHPHGSINDKFYNEMMKYSGEPNFNVKQLVDDIKAYYSPSQYKGHYAKVLHMDTYMLSTLEFRAREAKKKVLDLFKQKGIELKTKAYPIEDYGRDSSSSLRPVLERLEPYLPKKRRDKFFNTRYVNAYKKIEPQLYEIEKKMAKGLPTEEFKKLEKQALKIRSKYRSEEELQLHILLEIERMLNS